jgi:hypothetical protein
MDIEQTRLFARGEVAWVVADVLPCQTRQQTAYLPSVDGSGADQTTFVGVA